jgi:arylsulfatase A-like enzyme
VSVQQSWRVVLSLLLAAAVAPSSLGGCSSDPPERANVLLVTVDTLRPDRLSSYGYARHRTPHIDALAAGGALFENAVSDTPWTTPSMASVMTGVYATRHGFRSTNANRLSLDQETLAEVLKARGYATAAVVGSFPLDAIYQLDQGFDVYDDAFTTPIWVYPEHEPETLESEFRENPEDQAMFVLAKALNDSRRSDAEVTDAALAVLEGGLSEPFFLWVHYFGPHSKPDWTIPESARERRHLAQYDPDVRENDRELGRLLAGLEATGRSDDTLVVFHADHGESLGEQAYLGHGMLLNDASLRIPLILRLPGSIEAGTRVASLVRNVDIFPTILDVAGGSEGIEKSGTSLLPLVRRSLFRSAPEAKTTAYMETWYPAHRAFARRVGLPGGEEGLLGLVVRAVRDERWKLVRTSPHDLLDASKDALPEIPEAIRAGAKREQLFDLASPGGEGKDVIAEHPEVAARLRALLDAELAMAVEASPVAPLDEDARLRLEALGYGD